MPKALMPVLRGGDTSRGHGENQPTSVSRRQGATAEQTTSAHEALWAKPVLAAQRKRYTGNEPVECSSTRRHANQGGRREVLFLCGFAV